VNAYLPEHLVRVTIKDMIIGERAYTVPWSMQVDQQGRCWIRGDYSFTHQQFGTSRMSIRRTLDGFAVTADRHTQYEPAFIPPEAQAHMSLLPVVEIS
jgi:hypothetical protein